MDSFGFKVLHTDNKSNARIGEIHTPHGIIQTPAFVPVGTQATVKSLTPDDLKDLDVKLFFVNTYHAYLRPGLDVIKKFGGLHTFMGWDGPLITDSGGFQVFSLGSKKFVNIAISESAVLDRDKFTKKLSKKEAVRAQVFPDDYRPVGELVKIDEDGVTFTSHWDGSNHRFTPERSIEIQNMLGADIIIAFDECAPYPTTHAYAHKAMMRTHRWAERSLGAHVSLRDRSNGEAISSHKRIAASPLKTRDSRNDNYQALYGVVQGSVYEDLRKASAKFISSLDFDGIAIGGVSVGESKEEMKKVLEWVVPYLPDDKPRHLLGVGEIDDIFTLVAHGMDTFDCVQPTRLGRMGRIFTNPTNTTNTTNPTNRMYEIDITKKEFEQDTKPIDSDCTCYSCTHFSRAYLHHLFRVRELLAYRLATVHNIHFMNTLLAIIRKSIQNNTFLDLKKQWLYNM